MTRTTIGVLAALAAAALAAFATTVIGGETDAGPGNTPPPNTEGLATKRVAPAAGGMRAKHGGPNPRVVYYETTNPVDDIQPGPGGYIFEKCPKGSVVVNGYYFQTIPGETEPVGVFEGFGLDDQGSSPAGYRKWAFYWDNVATDQGGPTDIDGVTFGIICDKDG